jgi:hypothetical protein
VSALRKATCHFSLLANFKAAFINTQTQQVSNTDHTQLPHLHPGNIIQHSSWAD